MSKARDLADIIAAGAALSDGEIQVAEVTGAAPLASPSFTGAATFANTIAVGADSAGYTVDVIGPVASRGSGDGNAAFVIQEQGNNPWHVMQFTGGVFSVNYNGLDSSNSALAIDAAGNVGMGTIAPLAALDVRGEMIATSYNETYVAVTSSGAASTINCETGNTFSQTLTESTTFTFSNPPASGTAYTMTVEIIQDAGASGYTVTWPTSVDWPAATAPTLSATASAVDVFVFTTRDGGTTWYGFTAGQAIG